MDKLENEFAEFIQQVFKNFGLDSLSSKIVAFLYIEPTEISIERLSRKTGYSLSSISTKAKFLENVNIIEKIKKPGSKKVYYFMEKDIFKILDSKVDKVMEGEVAPAKENIPKIIEKYQGKKLTEKSKKTLNIIKNYHKQILAMEKLMLDFKKKLRGIKK